jgi:hypothetical protein
MKADTPSEDEPSKPASANQRILWGLLAAALAWGVILAVGALLKDTRRGLIALGFVALFALFWTWLLLRFSRRGARENSAKP